MLACNDQMKCAETEGVKENLNWCKLQLIECHLCDAWLLPSCGPFLGEKLPPVPPAPGQPRALQVRCMRMAISTRTLVTRGPHNSTRKLSAGRLVPLWEHGEEGREAPGLQSNPWTWHGLELVYGPDHRGLPNKVTGTQAPWVEGVLPRKINQSCHFSGRHCRGPQREAPMDRELKVFGSQGKK